MAALLGPALLIFCLRVLDVGLGTLRLLFTVRGRKGLTWAMGFFSAGVYLLALTYVLSHLGSWLNIVGYAAGFATGGALGMWIEEKMAMGFVTLRVISSRAGPAISECLREAGYAATELSGWGRDGAVTLLTCNVLRRDERRTCDLICSADPEAFITAEDMRLLGHGFFRS